ncbi:unnamed protein product [Cercopithifilaria johnstoni]|uniref:Uncharacterized protein n=1 Tax=Cercopithifilaria johnstoni TaxID=2874296 RepID=A0A8J2MUE7_9BILA|nr:unnamed protein product [Cercopithifilaria johnstoni]
MIICRHPTVTRPLRFKWKAFLREHKSRYHLTKYMSQQLTFESIIHDFTQQATAAEKVNDVKHSRQSVTSIRKSSERSTRSEIIEFLVKCGIPYSLTPYLGDIRTKCLHCKSLDTACISFRDTSIMCTICGHATTFDIFRAKRKTRVCSIEMKIWISGLISFDDGNSTFRGNVVCFIDMGGRRIALSFKSRVLNTTNNSNSRAKVFKLLLEEVERQPVEETKPFVLRPLLQKDPKEGTWKYVTALQVPKEVEVTLEEGRGKGNHLPAMDDASPIYLFSCYSFKQGDV